MFGPDKHIARRKARTSSSTAQKFLSLDENLKDYTIFSKISSISDLIKVGLSVSQLFHE
jgi:hypothetical protein